MKVLADTNNMKRLILTAALCTSLGLSAQMPGWGEPQSRVVTDSIDSRVLGAVRRYNVYLPKSFDA